MQIALAKKDEEDALQRFREKEWPGADKEHYGDDLPDFDKKKEYLLAKESDVIVGYISYTLEAGVGLIGSLIVAKDLRGKGIASQLLTEAEKKLKEANMHKVCLETGKDWAARKLYEKHGYEVRAVLPNHYGKQDFVLMDKMI